MRILHTSDWHLGRTLKGVDLTGAQADIIDQIEQIVTEHQIDVVVIAGDVYDRAIPHTDAVRQLHSALSRICARATVVITPGNHDSAVRLGFGAQLFSPQLHVRAELEHVVEPLILEDDAGPVGFYCLPFLDPEEVRGFARSRGDEVARTQAAAMAYVMELVHADRSDRGLERTVVVAHAFVLEAGANAPDVDAASDSERDITAGGLDYVPSSVFDGVSFVALGHLHGARQLRTTPQGTVLAYSGSPLRFSFSEVTHRKGVTIVELDDTGQVLLERIELRQPRGMAKLRGEFADFMAAGAQPASGPFVAHTEDWVDITIVDKARPDELRSQLLNVFPHMLSHAHEPEGLQQSSASLGAQVRATQSPITIMKDFVEAVVGEPPSDEELEVLQGAYAASFEGGD